MPAVRAHRTITDDLLIVAIRIKREAGVGHADIQVAIDKFSSQEHWQERTGGIGFPTIEDIPQNHRGEFLAAIAALAPPQRGDRKPQDRRNLSVADIWPSRVA
jgi:hypothetical protein